MHICIPSVLTFILVKFQLLSPKFRAVTENWFLFKHKIVFYYMTTGEN
jgi:hypothetical protein